MSRTSTATGLLREAIAAGMPAIVAEIVVAAEDVREVEDEAADAGTEAVVADVTAAAMADTVAAVGIKTRPRKNLGPGFSRINTD